MFAQLEGNKPAEQYHHAAAASLHSPHLQSARAAAHIWHLVTITGRTRQIVVR